MEKSRTTEIYPGSKKKITYPNDLLMVLSDPMSPLAIQYFLCHLLPIWRKYTVILNQIVNRSSVTIIFLCFTILCYFHHVSLLGEMSCMVNYDVHYPQNSQQISVIDHLVYSV